MSREPIEFEGKDASVDASGSCSRCEQQPAGQSPGPKQQPQPPGENCDSVALLVCEVFGGRLPEAFGPPATADLRVSIGKSHGLRRATEVSAEVVPGVIQEKQCAIIEKLTKQNLTTEQIALALGEEVMEVERVVRKRGQNLQC